ncbi:SRPBCC domain-containing protein [Asticcacaulis sp. YBE204]|uniref:SRPBCC domain-containing protein n=1 Tax=Asticcacaulis sp. YBE204 TaxID=1282363 RepID=UPI0003C3E827|nr:SRPBCC domain-containing protein [Asticcacaulis sp. YBE204]ESQ79913.1 polyketide cyclase [Asticcacaulis sp. YBE204]
MALKIEKRIGISTAVDVPYEIMADINSWPSWSPIHKSAEGTLGFGAPVKFEEYYEGLGTWEVAGFVDDWTPLSHIHIGVPKKFYEGSLIRFYEFEILSDTACHFTIGAQFSGFLSEREGKRYRKFLREGFEKFAEALKAKAEGAI